MRPFYRTKQMRCIVQRKRQDVRIAKFTFAGSLKRSGANWENPITIAMRNNATLIHGRHGVRRIIKPNGYIA